MASTVARAKSLELFHTFGVLQTIIKLVERGRRQGEAEHSKRETSMKRAFTRDRTHAYHMREEEREEV